MTSFAEYDYLFKILIVGDSGVGKTSVLLRYTNNSFSTDLVSTIGSQAVRGPFALSDDSRLFCRNLVGMDFKVKTLNVMGKTVKLQIVRYVSVPERKLTRLVAVGHCWARAIPWDHREVLQERTRSLHCV